MYPDSKFLIFRGLSIHYRIAMPEGPILHRVLLLPSPGQSTYNWRRIVPELLKAGCLCVLCDLPGFGFSACGPGVPHRQELRAQILWGVLDHIDMEHSGSLKCWNLIGHGSAAGTVAMMAIQQPDSASSLTMINPILYPVVPRPLKKLFSGKLAGRLIRRWYRRHLQNRARFRRLVNWAYGCRLPGEALEKLRKPFVRLGSDAAIQKLLLQGYEIPLDRLHNLFMPAMVIWGGRDRLLGGTIPPRLCNKYFTNAEYHLLKHAGHFAAETSSSAVCDYLRGWIREMW